MAAHPLTAEAVMLMELSEEEQELIENYRKAGEEGKDAVRWAAEVAARVQVNLQKGRVI